MAPLTSNHTTQDPVTCACALALGHPGVQVTSSKLPGSSRRQPAERSPPLVAALALALDCLDGAVLGVKSILRFSTAEPRLKRLQPFAQRAVSLAHLFQVGAQRARFIPPGASPLDAQDDL